MYKGRTIFAALLLCTSVLSVASGTYAAGRRGQPAKPNNTTQGPVKPFGPTVNVARFRAGVETGVVGTVAGTSWALQLPQALPLTVTTATTTTVTEAGATATLAAVQQGLYVRVTGRFDTATHTFAAAHVLVLLPRVEGVVQQVAGQTLTVLSTRGDTVTVTTTTTTKWLKTAALRRHLRAGGTGQTTPISSTTTISNTVTSPPTPETPVVAVGDRILAEGTPGSDGLSITALRVLVGVPVGQPAVLPGDDTSQ